MNVDDSPEFFTSLSEPYSPCCRSFSCQPHSACPHSPLATPGPLHCGRERRPAWDICVPPEVRNRSSVQPFSSPLLVLPFLPPDRMRCRFPADRSRHDRKSKDWLTWLLDQSQS